MGAATAAMSVCAVGSISFSLRPAGSLGCGSAGYRSKKGINKYGFTWKVEIVYLEGVRIRIDFVAVRTLEDLIVIGLRVMHLQSAYGAEGFITMAALHQFLGN